ncbi:hypothetical protein P5V15_008185 [Pogonomyrmex californicus]
MICIKTRYFNIHRILLLAIGLWPYYKSNVAQFQIILCLAVLISFIISQLTIFLTTECTFLLIIKVLCTTTFSILYVIKYNSFLINARNVKRLMERLQQICNELKNEDEINIMKEYGNNTKRYTTVITLFCICCVFILIIMPILKPLLNIILHINKSESHKTLRFIIKQEYFIDQEKYSFLILLHINTFICIGSITVTATGTMLLGYMVHGCGMFKIASYRMEQAMTIKVFKRISTKDEIMIHKEIIYAVDIHRKAIKYVELLLSNFEGSFVLLILVGVVSLSLNLFAIFWAISVGNKEDCIFHFIFVSCVLVYMFLANYVAQEVLDHNSNVHATAYNVHWYIAPIQTQKLIFFILQKGNKIFVLKLGKLFGASLESFAMLIKLSMSYFTFMYSMQQ